jgi:hypothetical protein
MVITLVLLLSQSVAVPNADVPTPPPRQVLAVNANALPTAPAIGTLSGRAVSSPAPAESAAAFIQPVQPSKPVKRLPTAAGKRLWLGLVIAQHGAASFDAWTTRRKLQSGGYHENNPLLKPFAGNSSLYVAVQTTPLALDFISNRMRNSDRRWLRRLWWVPQVVQTGTHLTCGAMNLAK